MISDAQRARAFLKLWWIIWVAALVGLGLAYLVLARGRTMPVSPTANPFGNLVGFVPLFVSIIIRWLVLPRYRDLRLAFPLFIIGLALAESCGVLGIFLGGPYRDSLFVLGLLGLGQYMPFFARSYLEPKAEGFIPNN
jgi:hypothetical protein